MGRKRKGPWLRKQDNCYYTTRGRELFKLGTGDDPYEEIEKRYHEFHASREKPTYWTVAALVDEFLEYCYQRKSDSTYDWYKMFLTAFIDKIGTRKRIESLTPHDVNSWVDARYKDRSPSTKFGATRAVVRVCNWAVKSRLIQSTPLIGIEKPAPNSRETAITPEQFKLILDHVPDQEFKDVLLFFWNTGCRPQELRAIEARHVDGRKVVLDRQQSKGKKHKRVIYLNDTALEIVQRLATLHKEGAIFRNRRGVAWKKDAILNRMKRLRVKTELYVFAYALRHGYATEMLKAGTDTTTLAQLMGTSQEMIARVYQHVAKDDDYMLRAAKDGGSYPAVVVTGLPAVGGTDPTVQV